MLESKLKVTVEGLVSMNVEKITKPLQSFLKKIEHPQPNENINFGLNFVFHNF